MNAEVYAEGRQMSTEDLGQYDASQATHNLTCKHCMNSHQVRHYYMPCTILGETKSGSLKVVVFGNRYWSGTEDYKRIRYVPKWRVRKNEQHAKKMEQK